MTMNTNAEKKEKTRREYVIFFAIILTLVVIVQISSRISPEIPTPAPTTIVEEQRPSVPSVVEEAPERQDVLSCEFAEIRKHCNSGVLSELEMAQTLKVMDERRQFPHYGKKYRLTDKEYITLCKLVKAEATSMQELKNDYPDLSPKEIEEEHYNETLSIATVTLKRTFEEEYFPNDLTEVIFQKNQYSTANADNEEIYHYKEANVRVVVEESDITEDIMKAVDDALDGKDSTVEYVTDGAIFFYSDKYISQTERDKRANVKEKIKFGNTVFYR